MGLGRRLYRKAKVIDDRISESDRAYRLKKALDRLLPIVILGLLAVLYLEFFAELTTRQQRYHRWAQYILLAYFILELLVDLGLYENNKTFLRHKWLDILLVLPFFTAFKSVKAALRGLKGVKAAKAAKTVKPAKGAKAAKAGKAGKVAKTGRVGKSLKRFKYTQKGAKAVKKGKKIMKEALEEFEHSF